MNKLILKSGREKSILHLHPWIFSGAIERVEGEPQPGETVQVLDSNREPLGLAAYSPSSQIRARMWTFDPHQQVGPDLFREKLQSAISLRQISIPPAETDALRLVFAESDGLPGLIVDRYGDLLVMQCLSAGIDYWREIFADLLLELTGVKSIYERSDVDVRVLEGLPERVGPVRGEAPTDRIEIRENGLRFWVDVLAGHKTGFYLDQRANRNALRTLAAGRDVLNCFAYSGGFSIYSLSGGAHSVISIDSSADVLELGRENLALNGLNPEQAEWVQGDVFQLLRRYRDMARSFDLIVLDPPKFAQNASQAERAARGYKDINLLAFKLLRPGGLLFTFSCSGGVSADLFQKIVAGAAVDAGVEARIIRRLFQGPDHPVALNFPEGAYLKGLVVYKA